MIHLLMYASSQSWLGTNCYKLEQLSRKFVSRFMIHSCYFTYDLTFIACSPIFLFICSMLPQNMNMREKLDKGSFRYVIFFWQLLGWTIYQNLKDFDTIGYCFERILSSWTYLLSINTTDLSLFPKPHENCHQLSYFGKAPPLLKWSHNILTSWGRAVPSSVPA